MPGTRIPLLLVSWLFCPLYGGTELSPVRSQGTGLVGTPGSPSRFTDATEIQKWVDVMVKNGQPYIDTARAYGDGTAEKVSGVFLS